MFKNGKLFNKINIIDLCVILVIVLLIVGAVVKFGKFNSKTEEATQSTMEYRFAVNNIRDYTVNAFVVGDLVYDSQSGAYIGKITNIEKNESKTYEAISTGEVIDVKNPYRFDILLTIEAPITIEKDAYYINNTIELKVNSTKIIETKYVKTSGIVYDILGK